MKNWIKFGLYGTLVGFIVGIIYLIFPGYVLFRLSLPLSFIYTPLIKLLVTQFTLIQSISIFYVTALVIEGFVIGAIIGLIIQSKKKSIKQSKPSNKKAEKSKSGRRK